MAYEIIDRRADLENVWVDVQYNFLEEITTIPIFHPKETDDIYTAIENRQVSELEKKNQAALNLEIVAQLDSELL